MLLEEIYLLTKHGRFNAEYIESIPVYKRRVYLRLMEKEFTDVKEYNEKLNKKSKTTISKRKSR